MTCDSDSELRSVPLGQIAQIERGKFSARPRNDPKYFGGSVPFIQTGDVRNSNGRMTDYSQTLNSQGLKVSRLFPAGTLFMTIAANIGDLGVAEFATACPDSLVALSPRAGVDQRWLFHALSMMKPTLVAIATQNAQANLNLEKLNSLALNVPPHASQVSIANILDDADSMIIKLQRLIAKKQAIKQGMMQQLLTGRTRLPGFTKEWREVRLGEVTTWMSGGTPSRERAEYWAGDVPWISASTLKDIEVSHSDQCISAEAVRSSSKMAPLGSTLLLVRGSALHKEIRASLVVADVCFNQDVKALVPARELRPKFLTYLIHGHAGELLKLVSSAGNTAGVLDTAVVQSFVVRIPHVTEQQRIISVLDDVNKELTALQHRLTKARNIKTGMMQQLLTGRVRLPVDSES